MFSSDNLAAVSLAELMAAHNWQAQYRLITQWGKLVVHKPELRNAEHLVRGCEVSAWLAHQEASGVHYFAFDSDSRVINGLAVLLLVQVQAKTRLEIRQLDFEQLLVSVGLEKHLTPSRNNGVRAIIVKILELMH
jgi:cysteine desulfuration protein SufE